MKKRIIALLAVAVLLLGALSGCKEKEPQMEAPTGLEASLVVSYQGDEAVLTAINNQIVRFMTDFPGIQVTLDNTGTAEANIICDTPDQLATYLKEDKLLDMDTWFADSEGYVLTDAGEFLPISLTAEQQTDLVELYLDEGRNFEEKGTYMLPLHKESLAVYYNGTFLEENELDTPHTWETMELTCQLIKDKKPDATPIVCNDTLGLFLSLCAQFGAEYTAEGGVSELLATEGALQAATMLNGWYQKGYMTTEDLSLMDPGVYMVIDTSSHPQTPVQTNESFAFEMGVANLPRFEEGSGKVLATGVSAAILRSDDDDQMLAAWLLTKSLCTDVQFQAELAMAGNFTPVMTSVEINEAYSKYLDSADGADNAGALAALVCMEQQHKLFTAPVYEGSLEEKEKLTALVETCLQATDGVAEILEAGIA